MHEQGNSQSGIDSFSGICESTLTTSIIEPIQVKTQTVKASLEASSLILRIDDVIAAKRVEDSHTLNLD